MAFQGQNSRRHFLGGDDDERRQQQNASLVLMAFKRRTVEDIWPVVMAMVEDAAGYKPGVGGFSRRQQKTLARCWRR